MIEPRQIPSVDPKSDVMRAAALLGGADVLGCRVETALDAHDLVIRGLPSAALHYLAGEVPGLADSVLGVGRRRSRRRAAGARPDVLSPEEGDRAWRLACAVARATIALGARDAAAAWLMAPAFALDNRRPVDLLDTAAGAAALDESLTRIEFGVYC